MAKEKKVVKVEEEKDEEFFDEKKTKKDYERSTFSKIMNIVLWIVLLAWMAVCLIDFYNVHQEKDPKFCISKETIEYDDGTVESCLGLGYKVYQYNRESFSGIEFGPFWSKDRSADQEEK